jgi:hypothetical protein
MWNMQPGKQTYKRYEREREKRARETEKGETNHD